jgi:hypothetical protein
MAVLNKYKWLFILVNVTIPLFTMYDARNFPFSLKVLVAIISAVFLNSVLYFSIRRKERELAIKAQRDVS